MPQLRPASSSSWTMWRLMSSRDSNVLSSSILPITLRSVVWASWPNMVTPLLACDAASTLSARLGGDFERVSICARNINHGAGLERLRAVDARVPARAAIAHARKARGRIDPFLEARRHARVDRRHLSRAVLGPV